MISEKLQVQLVQHGITSFDEIALREALETRVANVRLES